MSTLVCNSVGLAFGGAFGGGEARDMDDNPHFFSDAVADMDADTPYPEAFGPDQLESSNYSISPNLAVDPMLLASPTATSVNTSVADTIVIPSAEAPPYGQNATSISVSSRRGRRGPASTQDQPPRLVHKPSDDSATTQGSIVAATDDAASSRKSKSTSISCTPPPTSPPPGKRRGNKAESNRKTEEGKDGRKDKLLERNRIAASKCRQRKKEYVSDLEETRSRLETQHSQLQVEYHTLLGEVNRMKTDVMTHATCNDPNINRWIEVEAKKYVEKVNLRCTAEQDGACPEAANQRPSTAPSLFAARRDSLSQYEPVERRGSMAFSQVDDSCSPSNDFWDGDPIDLRFLASSVEASPIDMKFPIDSPPAVQEEHQINYDHMPDSMFSSPKEH